jgi:hypothetical protein
LALSVPLSRFTSQVGGGSAFFVGHYERATDKTYALTIFCPRPTSSIFLIIEKIFRQRNFVAAELL